MNRSKNKIIVCCVVVLICVLGAGIFVLCQHTNSNGDLNSGIRDLVEKESYQEKDVDGRGEMLAHYLHDAAKNQVENERGCQVVEDSIEYDYETEQCIYNDSDGGVHVIVLEEDKNNEVKSGAKVGAGFSEANNITDVSGTILYGIDSPNSSNAKDYRTMISEMEAKGMECSMDDEMTVEDYKTELDDKDFVVIETHGTMLNYGYGFKNSSNIKVPVLCTLEEVTEDNYNKYYDDISEQRIVQVSVIQDESSHETKEQYWIMPSFFEKYYANDELDGTYIHMGNCKGFGAESEGGIDYTLAETFLNCGAEVVTGYYNPVFTYYDYSVIGDILSAMSSGYTVQEAVDRALELNGEDDEAYAEMMHWLDIGAPEYDSVRKKLDEGVAVINIIGNEDWSFAADYEYNATELSGTWRLNKYTYIKLYDNGDGTGTGSFCDHLGALSLEYEYLDGLLYFYITDGIGEEFSARMSMDFSSFVILDRQGFEGEEFYYSQE